MSKLFNRAQFVLSHSRYCIHEVWRWGKLYFDYVRHRSTRRAAGPEVELRVHSTSSRSWFNLCWMLQEAGYTIVWPHTMRSLLNLGDYDRWILRMPAVRLSRKNTKDSNRFTLKEDSPPGDVSSGHSLSCSFDFFRVESDATSVYLPFGAHPAARVAGYEATARSELDSDHLRPLRLFCAGNLSYPDYGRSCLAQDFGILDRLQFVNVLQVHFGDQICTDPMNIIACAPEMTSSIFLVDQAKAGLPMKEYFRALRSSQFALCPPGVNHPQCHNLYEAMVSGAIPIIEYGSWLRPPLRDGVDCLAFSGEEGLAAVIQRALLLPESDIGHLRNGVRTYVRQHVDSTAVLARLPAKKALYLLNEAASVAQVPITPGHEINDIAPPR